jgi:hypothetical protein
MPLMVRGGLPGKGSVGRARRGCSGRCSYSIRQAVCRQGEKPFCPQSLEWPLSRRLQRFGPPQQVIDHRLRRPVEILQTGPNSAALKMGSHYGHGDRRPKRRRARLEARSASGGAAARRVRPPRRRSSRRQVHVVDEPWGTTIGGGVVGPRLLWGTALQTRGVPSAQFSDGERVGGPRPIWGASQIGRTCGAHGRPQRGFTSTCRLAGLFVDRNALNRLPPGSYDSNLPRRGKAVSGDACEPPAFVLARCIAYTPHDGLSTL